MKKAKTIDNPFVLHVLDMLQCNGISVTARPMFGGYGIYSDGIMFGIVADDELYFKADAELAKEYQMLGAERFTYQTRKSTRSMCYYQVPAEVIDDHSVLHEWFTKSLTVAKAAKC